MAGAALLVAALAACTSTSVSPTNPPNVRGKSYPDAVTALNGWCQDLAITVSPGLPASADPDLLTVATQSYGRPSSPAQLLRVAVQPVKIAAAETGSPSTAGTDGGGSPPEEPPGTSSAVTPAPVPTTCAAGHHDIALTLQTKVPKLVGSTVKDARALLARHGLELAPPESGRADLVVMEQAPVADTIVPIDAIPFATAKVAVKLGVAVPDLLNSKEDQVCPTLQKAGLVCAIDPSGAAPPPGRVVSQVPKAQETVPLGTTVTVNVVREAILIPVPDVIGRTAAQACDLVKAAKMSCATVQAVGGVKPGTVFNQLPAAGTQVSPGQRVTVYVERAIVTVAVPKVVGKDEETACQALRAAKLECRLAVLTEGQQPGVVVSQRPAANTQVNPGTTVGIDIRRTPRVTVPDVVGQPGEKACQPIQAARLQCQAAPDDDADGKVVSQDPTPGSVVPEGTPVILRRVASTTTIPGWAIVLALALVVVAGAAIRKLTRPKPPSGGTPLSVSVRLVTGPPQARIDEAREW